MPANVENSAVATGLEKVSFHSNPKEGQCQRMFKVPHDCTHFTVPTKAMLKILQIRLHIDHNKLWKILRDGTTRLPDLPPKNLSARKEATVRTEHGTMNWFKIGKGVLQGCIMSLCLFNLYAEYIM